MSATGGVIDVGAIFTAAMAPLVEEMRALRAEVAALRDGRDGELLTIAEAATLLHKSPDALYKMKKRGTLAGVVMVGRAIRIRRGALTGGGK